MGIGASAGGLKAITTVVGGLSPTTPAAYVIVQHLSPDHPSLMVSLLSRRTSLRVCLAHDGVEIEGGTCYLMPPAAEITVEGSRLRVEVGEGERHAFPIDTFFASLAAEREGDAIALVLSGTGSDGTRGCVDVAAKGGLVLVQKPSSADFDGMPRSVIARGIADHVLDPGEMPKWLEAQLESGGTHSLLSRVIQAVRGHCGVDLASYKESTLRRRIARRMDELNLSALSEYSALVDESPSEGSKLVQSMFIDVTSFFRNPETFDFLNSKVIPELVERTPPNEAIRVWSAGCASGPEAYSLAVLFSDHLAAAGRRSGLKLFATDANAKAIEEASRGTFRKEQLEPLSPQQLDRYFVSTGTGYRVRDELRRSLIFAQHDLQRDPPFTQMAMVSCRNVLIYFRPKVQRHFLESFHFALRGGGVLLLGDSEAIPETEHAFEVIPPASNRVYRRVAGRSRGAVNLLLPRAAERSRTPTDKAPPIQEEAREQLLRSFVPLSVLVNPEGEVEHIFGDGAPYLQLPSGEVSRRIDRLARGNLGAVVAALIARVKRTGAAADYPGVALPEQEGTVHLLAAPVQGSAHVLVSFRPIRSSEVAPADDTQLEDIQGELLQVRQNLQSTIEELQTANEELQAANEEMHASNEELQATNEELHATNEELHALTAERQLRVSELTRLNADVASLLEVTGAAIVFLDDNLRIRSLLGPVSRYVRILPQDLERPISDFALSLRGTNLEALARRALEEGVSVEDDAAWAGTRNVLARAHPYTADEGAGGVVLALLDVTQLKETQNRLRGVLDSLPQHVALLDRRGHIVMVNEAWRRFALAQGGDAGVGADYLQATAADPTAADVLHGITAVLKGDVAQFSAEYPCDTPKRSLLFRMDACSLVGSEGHGIPGAVVSHLDITERVYEERRQRFASEAFAELFDLSSNPVLLLEGSRLVVKEANGAASALFQRRVESLVGTSVAMLVPPARVETWERTLRDALANKEIVRVLEVVDAAGNDIQVTAVTRGLFERPEPAMLVELRLPSRNQGAQAEISAPLKRSRRLEALGNLAGGVAHETNNVLAAIVGLMEGWSDDESMPPELRDDVRDVLAACKRGGDVAQQLLGFARADAMMEPLQLHEVVEEVVRVLRRTAHAAHELVVHNAEHLVVVADRTQLSQAISNMALNGLDAMQGKTGKLTLSVAERLEHGSRMAVISVEDEGSGMPADVQARAFEPFFTTKQPGAGTGLGLPMVYGLARSLGGIVDIQSTVGVGTRISMVLPTSERHPAASRHKASVDRLEGKVLLVDDDDLVRRGMARMLRRVGLETTEAPSGEGVLDALKEKHDIVVLDVVMPGLDGWQVLRQIRAVHPRLPVLLCSGYAENPSGEAMDDDPFTRFAYKPIGMQELVRELSTLLSVS